MFAQLRTFWQESHKMLHIKHFGKHSALYLCSNECISDTICTFKKSCPSLKGLKRKQYITQNVEALRKNVVGCF